MKGLGDDSMQIDVTSDEKEKKESMNRLVQCVFYKSRNLDTLKQYLIYQISIHLDI